MKNRISGIGLIFIQELKNIFSNKAVIIVFFVATILYPIVYGYTYSPELLREIPVAVIDRDNSQMSRKYVRMIDACQNMTIAYKCNSMQEAKLLFIEGKVHGIIRIPNDFSSDIYKEFQTFVSVYSDASYFLMYKQVLSDMTMMNMSFTSGIQVKKLLMKGMPLQEAKNFSFPIRAVSVALYNPTGGYGSYAMPAILILILQQTLLMGIGILMGNRKENDNWSHLRSFKNKRLGGASVIIGKSLAYFLIYSAIAVYCLFAIFRIFDFPQKGHFIDVFLFLIPFLLSVIFMGFTISIFFRKNETSIILLAFTTIPFLFLTGFSWPVESMPLFFRIIRHAIPSTPGVLGFLHINQMGVTLWDVKEWWYELWVHAGIYFILASLVMRYRIYKLDR